MVKIGIQKGIIYNGCSKLKLQDIDISTQYQAKLDEYNKLAEEIKDEGISQEVIEKVERKADRTKPPQKEAAEGLQARPETRQEVTPTTVKLHYSDMKG